MAHSKYLWNKTSFNKIRTLASGPNANKDLEYKTGVDTMSAERREEVEGDLGTRRRDLERDARDADAELTRRRQKAVRDIEQEVAAILDDYGKRNAFTLIMQRDLCAFATDSIDISDELVKLLDARTATRPAGAAASGAPAARRP